MITEELSRPSALHAPDGEFEYWSCHVIASDRSVDLWDPYYDGGQCKFKKSVNKASIQLPANDVVLIRTIANVTELVKHPGAIFYSQISNEPLCDAAAVLNNELLLFQMTIGKDHSLKEQTLRSCCKAAKEAQLQRVRFVFVVPHLNNFCVKGAQIRLFDTDFGLPVALHVAEVRPSK